MILWKNKENLFKKERNSIIVFERKKWYNSHNKKENRGIR